ncbi:MAG: hypothetical protein IJC76_04845 [Lachnospiraceae bacterium]|nr:hypothetical protein [Lachnospiraceae bacterium]
MNKRVVYSCVGILIVIFIVVLILFVGDDLHKEDVKSMEGIDFLLETDIYSDDKESISGIIYNKTEEKYTSGDAYYLKCLKDDSWVVVSPKVNTSEDLLYIYEENSKIERKYNLKEKYYPLEKRIYKIGVVITNTRDESFSIEAQFQVN